MVHETTNLPTPDRSWCRGAPRIRQLASLGTPMLGFLVSLVCAVYQEFTAWGIDSKSRLLGPCRGGRSCF